MSLDELMNALKEVLSVADEEERELTDEEVERYEELEGKIESVKKTEEIRSRQKAYDTPIRPDVGLNVGTTKNDDTLERAFEAYVRTGTENQDLQELRAQQVGVDPAGGFTAPDGFRNKLIDRIVQFGGLASVVQTETTSDGNPLPWQAMDDSANSGEIVAEGATFTTGADLSFTNKTLGAYSYMAGGDSANPLRVSKELLQDSAYDIAGLVSRKLGERIGRIQATHIATGTGTNEPQGITTGLTGVELADAGDGITHDDLVSFIHSVDPGYRMGARWAFNDNTLQAVRKMRDAAGDPLWRNDAADMATSNGGGTLMGYPVTIDQGLPDLVAGDATVNWGVFGQLAEGYVIRRVRSIEIVANPWARSSHREIEYTAWARMDAMQQNVNAYKALTGAA